LCQQRVLVGDVVVEMMTSDVDNLLTLSALHIRILTFHSNDLFCLRLNLKHVAEPSSYSPTMRAVILIHSPLLTQVSCGCFPLCRSMKIWSILLFTTIMQCCIASWSENRQHQ
jgi:hypothetical protein